MDDHQRHLVIEWDSVPIGIGPHNRRCDEHIAKRHRRSSGNGLGGPARSSILDRERQDIGWPGPAHVGAVEGGDGVFIHQRQRNRRIRSGPSAAKTICARSVSSSIGMGSSCSSSTVMITRRPRKPREPAPRATPGGRLSGLPFGRGNRGRASWRGSNPSAPVPARP